MTRLWIGLLVGVSMAHAEELPVFDKLWNYQKPAETRAKFLDVLVQAEKSGDASYHLQLLTQIARTYGLEGKFDDAHKVLDDVEKKLTDDLKLARVRYLLERGRAYNSSKKVEKARPLFEQAWDLARKIEEHGFAVDAAHMCAIAAAKPEDKRAWNLRAIEYAEESKDKRALGWLGALYNNMGWDYYDEREFEKALAMHEKCLAWHMERNPEGRGALIAKWSVAKQLRMLGRIDEALKIQRALLAHYEKAKEPDGFVFEELGECLHAQGKRDEARPWFGKAYETLKEIPWVAEDKERIERLRKLSAGSSE